MASLDDLMHAKTAMSERFLVGGREVAPRMATAQFALEQVTEAVEPARNLHTVSVGRKLVMGRPSGEMAVRLHVTMKLPPSLVGDAHRLPASMDGIPTDIIESPPAAFAGTTRVRPSVPGSSIGHYQITAGTLGCFCRSRRPEDGPDRVYVLSNNHVLANLNRGLVGDAILQPGKRDGGTSDADRVARLARFAKLDMNGGRNKFDAALAELDVGAAWDPAVVGIGRIIATVAPDLGMTVRKQGRTTDYTEGHITDIAADVAIPYGSGSIVFENQFRIGAGAAYPRVASGGDSGSLVVDGTNRAVGLLFACPPDGSYALAAPSDVVLSGLEVDIH